MSKLKLYFNFITCLLSLLVRKNKNRWVFGAWFGSRISDNPYSLFQYVKEKHPEIEAVWICDDPAEAQKKGINAIKRNSLDAIWKCLTAGVAVMNQCYLDFGDYCWIHHSYKVQLWHGVPWKKIGEDAPDEKRGLLHYFSHKTFLYANKCDLFIAPSDETRKVIKTAFLAEDGSILSIGQPRNQVLMDDEYCRQAREHLCNEIGYYRSIILYMPTFRDKTAQSFSFFDISSQLTDFLIEKKAVVVEKPHFVDNLRSGGRHDEESSVINVGDYDTQELLAAADILITDYSSCFFDFLLRDKPIIHFLYDIEEYKNNDRGLYYDLDYTVAGEVTFTQSELLDKLGRILAGEDRYSQRRKLIRERFDTYESKNNSQVITNAILQRTGMIHSKKERKEERK